MATLTKTSVHWCFVLALVLSGCQTMVGDEVTTIRFRAKAAEKYDEFVSDKTLSARDMQSKSNEAIALDLNYVLNACVPVMSKFENSAKKRSAYAFGIAILGLVAGAIAIPALAAANATANAAWIGGLGGLAGAANTSQQVLHDQGLTSVEALKTREQIRIEFNTALNEYATAENNQKRRIALEKAYASCMVYAVHIPDIKISTIPTPKESGQSEISNNAEKQ